MRSTCCWISIAPYLCIVVFFSCFGKLPASAEEPTAKDLVGTWEMEDKVTIFTADGTGTNPDASRFRWELKEGRLFARRLAPDGKLGEEWSVLIAFTKDRKEYSYLLGADNGGLRRITRYKLDRKGRRFSGRADADRAYPPDSEALKGEGPPEASAPNPAPRALQSAPRSSQGASSSFPSGQTFSSPSHGTRSMNARSPSVDLLCHLS